jgi:hypothetical protein
MKKIILLLIITGIYRFSAAQQPLTADKVPAQVLMAFHQSFPRAEGSHWQIMDDSTYGVFFSLGSKWRHFAKCDSHGELLMHKENIDYSVLPDAVKQATQQYEGFEPRYISQVDTAGQDLAYDLFLIKGHEFYIIRYTSRGEVLRNEGKKILE